MCSLHFRSDTACTDFDFLYFGQLKISCEVFTLVSVGVCDLFCSCQGLSSSEKVVVDDDKISS